MTTSPANPREVSDGDSDAPGQRGLSSCPLVFDPQCPELPEDVLGELREQAPVVRITLPGGLPAWMITRFDDVRAGLGDPRLVQSPLSVPGFTGEDPRMAQIRWLGLPERMNQYLLRALLDLDAPDHTRLRKAVAPHFTARRIHALRPRVEQITDRLLSGLPGRAAADGSVDFIEEVAFPLSITVICEMVGIPEQDRPLWRRWADDLNGLDTDLVRDSAPALVDHVLALIEERRRTPGDDLISAMVGPAPDGEPPLPERDIVTMTMLVTNVGYENTAYFLANGLAALLAHPDQLDLLRDDPALLPSAVTELLRWGGSVPATRPRFAAQDIDLHGTRIRAGEAVALSLLGANRDHRYHPDADRLDITRYQDAQDDHVALGHGAHYCLGAALVRLETQVLLGALTARFPGLRLAVAPDRLERVHVPGVGRRLTRLPLHL
ncbi:cytochrome P450 [Kitasatospora sp. NPDC057512]|uniref:cytochrome P450 family protein n=1 Tax=Kitasatospora sp. NPDC057512 TaxID=3346154 RepID=UPI0036AF6F15